MRKRVTLAAMLSAMILELGFVGAIALASPREPREKQMLLSSNSPSTQPTAPHGKGSVCGVVMKDGKPVANVTVRLMQPRRGRGGAAERSGPNAGTPKPNGSIEQPAGDKGGHKHGGGAGESARSGADGGGTRPMPIAEATTDDQGKFTLADVPAGSYVVIANVREQGVARSRLTVAEGQTANVTLTLEPRAAGGKKAGKGNR